MGPLGPVGFPLVIGTPTVEACYESLWYRCLNGFGREFKEFHDYHRQLGYPLQSALVDNIVLAPVAVYEGD